MSTFISIGNAKQSFSRFFKLIDQVEHLLPKPVYIQRGHTSYDNENSEIVDFIDMNSFEYKISKATLIIIHAGAGSVIHAIKKNRKPIIIPREKKYQEHVDDHQVEFSTKLAELDKVLVARNTDELKKAIGDVLSEVSEVTDINAAPDSFQIIRTTFEGYEKIFDDGGAH